MCPFFINARCVPLWGRRPFFAGRRRRGATTRAPRVGEGKQNKTNGPMVWSKSMPMPPLPLPPGHNPKSCVDVEHAQRLFKGTVSAICLNSALCAEMYTSALVYISQSICMSRLQQSKAHPSIHPKMGMDQLSSEWIKSGNGRRIAPPWRIAPQWRIALPFEAV